MAISAALRKPLSTLYSPRLQERGHLLPSPIPRRGEGKFRSHGEFEGGSCLGRPFGPGFLAREGLGTGKRAWVGYSSHSSHLCLSPLAVTRRWGP